jgi:signal transduction histidine kinase
MSHASIHLRYRTLVAQRIEAESRTLAARWLERLVLLLPVGANEVFPTDQLLDHVPRLLEDIGRYLRAPEQQEIAANTAVIEKARELGLLRHEQRASVHQLLREYEILADVLEAFVLEVSGEMDEAPALPAGLAVTFRLAHAVRTLMRTTVDTFVSQYTETITRQTERIESFNHMVAHELRNSLTTVRFAVELLDRDEIASDPSRRAHLLATTKSTIHHVANVLHSLQQMTARTHDHDSPSRQEVDIAAIATDVARQLREMAAARGVEIQVAADARCAVTDPGLLELVLLNLVSNAIKYSDQRKPRPFVRVVAGTEPGALRVEVADNGIGIPAEDREAVFQRFFRAHADRDGELGIDGTGLGLAIVKDCVESLGGTIAVESAVGRGTTFLVRLPASTAS